MRQGIIAGCFLLSAALRGAGQSVPQPSLRDATPQTPVSAGRGVSWSRVIPNIASDQKRIWGFPLSVARGAGWKPALAVTAGVAALVALDPGDAPYFRRTSSYKGFNRIFSGNNTALVTLVFPASFYAAGLWRKDSYARNTALLAGEAVADAEILTLVMKDVDRRLRPSGIAPHGDFSDSWFRGRGGILRVPGSFPSGHTIAAFSIATVFARRYPGRRWVPYAAYGAAAVIGFSRVSLSAHFPSDVFMGAALGYSISRFAVLR